MGYDEIDARLGELREAADASARNARTSFTTFLVVWLYVAILAGSTTDEQLLRGAGIELPVLSVELPIVGVYAIVAPLFLLFHLNVLLQLYFLARKLHALNDAMEHPPGLRADRSHVRSLLFPFAFSELIAGGQASPSLRVLLHLLAFTTVVVLPVVLLLAVQLAFLPYHHATIVWVHRASVLLDLALVLYFWPCITHPEAAWRLWPFTFPEPGAPRRSRVAGLSATVGAFLAAWLSVFVFAIPEEWSERREFEHLAAYALFGEHGRGQDAPFHRNLVLRETILVREPPAAEVIAAFLADDQYDVPEVARAAAFRRFAKGLDLRDRDLRYADFAQADLTNVDVRGSHLADALLPIARLGGANLRDADLEGADLRDADLQGADLRGADLQGVDLMGARLQSADLRRADLEGAVLWRAGLQGANLRRADLQGANLRDADLQGAVLRDADLQGADLRDADLRRARLERADLQGADLQGATLAGADLGGADLQGASLGGADLQGATLRFAGLQGADLRRADLQGAILVAASLHGVMAEGARLELTDWRGADFGTPVPDYWATFMRSLIELVVPTTSRGGGDFNPRSAAQRRLRDAEDQSAEGTRLPACPVGDVLTSSPPESHPSAEPCPLRACHRPDLDQEAFWKRVVEHWVRLACGNEYVAAEMAARVHWGFEADPGASDVGQPTRGRRTLAQALLGRTDDDACASGLGRLSEDDLQRLRNIAG